MDMQKPQWTKGQSKTIHPTQRHKAIARGGEMARALVLTLPAWTPQDHKIEGEK